MMSKPLPNPRFSTVGELVRAQATAFAGSALFVCDGRRTTFEALDVAASQVAHGLSRAGIGRGDRILWLAKNTDSYFEVLAGAAKLGAVVVPINWRLAAPELRTIVEDAEGRALIAEDGLRDLLRGAEAETAGLLQVWLSGYQEWRDAQSSEDANWPVSPDDPLLQLYTSGTTGKPKGVVGTHRALLALRTQPDEHQPAWNRWRLGEVSLTVSPQFHIAGTGQGLQALCSGGCAVIMSEFRPERLIELVALERPARLFLVPTMIGQLLQHPGIETADFSSVKLLVYGSSPMPLGTLKEIMDLWPCGLVQQYGMTEITGTATVLTPEDHASGAGTHLLSSAGRAWPGVEIFVVGADGRALPAGTVGEVVIKTPTIMSEYWRKPDETRGVLTGDGGYRTGDAGYLDENGYLFLVDRIKDMIVSGGENVFPAEVEIVLRQYPGVADVAVIGVPHQRWGEAVAAFVIPAPGAALDTDAILGWARERIAGYKLPKLVEIREQLPRNANGKVLKRELRAAYWADSSRQIG